MSSWKKDLGGVHGSVELLSCDPHYLVAQYAFDNPHGKSLQRYRFQCVKDIKRVDSLGVPCSDLALHDRITV